MLKKQQLFHLKTQSGSCFPRLTVLSSATWMWLYTLSNTTNAAVAK